jgi:predicted amidohydrolase YtcJ
MREGIVAGGGSDGKSCEWRTNILFWIDLTRQTRFSGILGPELALTREEMLRYHTINAAYVLGEEKKLGSIEVGKQADLVVLSKDVMECPIDDLLHIQALMTIVDGKFVYQNKSKESPLVWA